MVLGRCFCFFLIGISAQTKKSVMLDLLVGISSTGMLYCLNLDVLDGSFEKVRLACMACALAPQAEKTLIKL